MTLTLNSAEGMLRMFTKKDRPVSPVGLSDEHRSVFATILDELNIETGYAWGSRVHGCWLDSSDWDLIVVGQDPIIRRDIVPLVAEKLGIRIDLMPYPLDAYIPATAVPVTSKKD